MDSCDPGAPGTARGPAAAWKATDGVLLPACGVSGRLVSSFGGTSIR